MKRVVIVGGGFGGLSCAHKLAGSGLDVVLIDKNDYTLFQPMLYQVAAGGLAEENIRTASPRCWTGAGTGSGIPRSA